MDPTPGTADSDPVVLSAVGWETSEEAWACLLGTRQARTGEAFPHDCRPLDFLQSRKSLKFMSRQDRLAVSAAGKALATAGLVAGNAGAGAGLFLCVGYIPFERDEAESLCVLSQSGGRFSMDAFSTEAYSSINPIRAFTCLPNMTAHHLAVNFGIQGEYFLTYPGTPQLYLALGEAVQRLREGSVSLALVGGVADQTNLLVAHHHRKTSPDGPRSLADAAAFLVLERESTARRERRTPLCRLDVWTEHLGDAPEAGARGLNPGFGAAELPLGVAAFLAGGSPSYHHAWGREGGVGSTWHRVAPVAAGAA
ncbi:MAG: beta-ketoacyl synthase N-terminal-like domain-containing protein [Actinomycetota bacterium]|nr:beta-ketoacyl synthase N-terminal-like domain-containing protein [Actinomycetota bacterium]